MTVIGKWFPCLYYDPWVFLLLFLLSSPLLCWCEQLCEYVAAGQGQHIPVVKEGEGREIKLMELTSSQ